MSQRRAFTILMTLFATTFGIAISGQLLGGQNDVFTDIVKIASLIGFSTAVISFAAWTLTHLKKDSVKRGAAAGFLTAVTIIPLPAFVWHFKTQFMSALEGSADNIFTAFFGALPPAIYAGLYTFIDISKASLIAICASMALGAVLAHFLAPQAPKAQV